MRTQTRRRQLLLLGIGLFIARPSLTYAEDELKIDLLWKIPADKVPAARDALHISPEQIAGDPASIDSTKGLPLVYIVIGVVLLPELAKSLVSVYKDWKYGPTIIQCDADGKCKIEHDPRGTGNSVVIASKDVQVQVIQNPQTVDAAKWMDVILKAISSAAHK